MTSMLTLVTHLSGLRAELPPVAYVKTVDFWIFGCMFSIFLALVEFAIVKVYLFYKYKLRRLELERNFFQITHSLKAKILNGLSLYTGSLLVN